MTLLFGRTRALEAQIERALELSCDESNRLAKRYGVPAAWLRQVSADIEDEFWNMVPAEYIWLREILRAEGRGGYAPVPRDDESAAIELLPALQKRGAVSGDPWMLPITSPVERLSRLWKLHPVHSALTLFRGAAVNDVVHAAVAEPMAFRRALTTLLDRLGHQWWSDSKRGTRVSGVTLSQTEAARLILQNPSAAKDWGGGEREVTEWLRGRFSSWHTKLFRQRSPLREQANTTGEISYSHRWDEPFVEPIT